MAPGKAPASSSLSQTWWRWGGNQPGHKGLQPILAGVVTSSFLYHKHDRICHSAEANITQILEHLSKAVQGCMARSDTFQGNITLMAVRFWQH